MWILTYILILCYIRITNGNLNRTYMLFIQEDVSIGHKQIIDTYDLSYCSKHSLQNNSPFEILLKANRNCTLILHVIQLLDREQTSSYIIEQQLLGKDDSITIQLSIVILDVNDHIPQFETEHFYFHIQENVLPGTFIGRVKAYDPDILLNGKISYRLSDNETKFRINQDTGEIFLSDFKLDYEIEQEYTIIVEAKDNGDSETTAWPSLSSYADITITIEDINDEKPQIILNKPDDNHVVIMNISKPQLNKDQNHLINSFHSHINLIENDAEIVLLTKEEPLPANTLLALLHLRDKDQISNELLTLDLQTYVQCSTEENFTKNITFRQISNYFHLSIFRSNVYGLFISQTLDREEYENFFIHLIANDNNNETLGYNSTFDSLQSELFIYLNLLDINDNNPIFNQTYFHIKIDENQSNKKILTRVHAYDIDKGKNGTVNYELVVKKSEIFSLDKFSGSLRARYRLDREQCEFYRIGIRAYDLGYPQRRYSSIILIDIEINNINDHIPYFMHDIYHFDIEENESIGKIIGRLLIGDRDEQEPIEEIINLSTIEDEDIKITKSKKISRINYSMIDFLFVDSQQNHSSSGLFSIDSQGFIHALASFDREYQSNYSLYISMYDPILKSYALPTNVIINILDKNDNVPYEPYLSNMSILSIEQIDNEETIIYEFQPIDYDDGLNGFVSIECLNCTSIFYFYMRNSSTLITYSNQTIPDGIYTLTFILRDHGLIISHQRLYTLTFNLTHRSNTNKQKGIFDYTKFFSTLPWYYFLIIWFIFVLIACWICYHYYRISIDTQIYEPEINSDFNDENINHNNLNSITIQNHSTQIILRSRSFSQLHNTCSHCQLSSSIMNSRETILTNAATNTSYHEDNNDIWQPMNNNNNNTQILYDDTNSYQFQPINQDYSSNLTSSQINNSHLIQRPVPISNSERSKKSSQYSFQGKRNSTVNIDTTIRSYGLPRSMTSEHLANNTPNRLYYYPSVQDVLDALNRRSFDKESYV